MQQQSTNNDQNPATPATPTHPTPNSGGRNFFRTLQLHMAPWTLSILLHVGVIIILGFVYVFHSISRDQTLSVPDVRLTRSSSPAPLLRSKESISSISVPAPSLEIPIPQPSGSEMEETSNMDLLGGESEALGLWPADATDASADNTSSFFSAESEGRNVVYVADWSGSLISGGTYDLVLKELARSIKNLAVSQYFHVIIFSAGKPREMMPSRLTPATDRAKLRAWRFISSEESASGTEPLPALRRAFAVLAKADPKREGKIIFLLTDGYMDVNELRTELRKLNPHGEVSVNIILHQEQKLSVRQQLETIATENNGMLASIEGR